MAGGTTNATSKLLLGEEGGGVGLYCPTSSANAIAPPPLVTATASSSSSEVNGGASLLQHVFPLQMTASLMPRFAALVTNNSSISASAGGGGVAAAGSAVIAAVGQPVATMTSGAIIGGHGGLSMPATHFNVVPGAAGAIAAGGLVGPGVSIVQTNAGITGPIIIRQQPQITASTNGVQRVVIGAQQRPTGRVLVNSNPPRTLLKNQIIQPTQMMSNQMVATQPSSSQLMVKYASSLPQQQQQQEIYQHQLQQNYLPEIQHTEASSSAQITVTPRTPVPVAAPNASKIIVIATTSGIATQQRNTIIDSAAASAAPIMQISKDVVLTMSSTSNLSTSASTSAAAKLKRDQDIRRAFAADFEKQESLLKLKPKQIAILDNQNVRANFRSKSLQEMKTGIVVDEANKRRLSTSAISAQQRKAFRITPPREENKIKLSAPAPENKIQLNAPAPAATLAPVVTPAVAVAAVTAAIDLVEYDMDEEEEDYLENSDNVLIIDEGEDRKDVPNMCLNTEELNEETAEPEDTAENADLSLIIIEDEKIHAESKVNNMEAPLEIVEARTAMTTTTTTTSPPHQTPLTQIQDDACNSIDATTSSFFDDKSLLCDEKILTISSLGSTSSTSNSNNSLQEDLTLPAPPIQQQVEQHEVAAEVDEGGEQPQVSNRPLQQPPPLPPLTPLLRDPTAKLSDVNSMSSVLNMLSNFNSLTWKERIGSARGTSMRFELNEFNLVQIHERCAPRYRLHTAYEKAIYERESRPVDPSEASSSSGEPLLYLCRRCCCHGPASEFLAPEFCSLECTKRDARKRNRDVSNLLRKRPRKDPMLVKQNQNNVASTSSASSSSSSSSNALTVSASNASSTSAANTNAASVLRKSVQFRWSTYLTGKYGITAAPIDLFINPFPTGPHHFKVGMKVEAIDPANCALFCVCTIVAIQGYRLKLNIDGYDCMHDFWLNADSMDIFPPGYCQKYGRVLQAPRGMDTTTFSWMSYLAQTKARAAHRQLFTHLNSSSSTSPTRSSRNPFRLGMQLEAEDLNDTGKLCVATVCDTIDERVRVHFDGYASCYDYWVAIDSPYIHPCGWHEGRAQLIAPPDMHLVFNWRDYLLRKGAGFMPAPASFFKARKPIEYKPHMKLEVIDPRNPSLIRPATVIGRKGHRVKLHLDGWPTEYCFWLEDDSPDLHPIGWCDVTGHDLEPPPGYTSRRSTAPPPTLDCMPGCRGVGNAKRLHLSTHTTRDCCPYAPENWRLKNISKPPRVIVEEIVRRVAVEAAGGAQLAPVVTLRQYLRTTQPPPLPQEQQEPSEQKPEPQSQPQMSEAQILARLNILDNLGTRACGVPKQEASVPPSLLQQPKSRNSVAAIKPQQESHKIKQQLSKSAGKVVKPTPTAAVAVTQNGVPAPPSSQSSSSQASSSSPTSSSTSSSSSSKQVSLLEVPSELRSDYGPRAEQNYSLWLKHLGTFGFDPESIQSNPLRWTTAETCAFVKRMLKCSKTATSFAEVDIDGAALLQLQQSDMTEQLELKLGPAVKLYSCILQLRMLAMDKYGVRPLQAEKKAIVNANV